VGRLEDIMKTAGDLTKKIDLRVKPLFRVNRCSLSSYGNNYDEDGWVDAVIPDVLR